MVKKFNERLAELMKVHGYNQKELAKAIDVTEAAMSHYIKGDRMPRAAILMRIADALNTTTDDLVGIENRNVNSEIVTAQRLIARNVHQMTKEQKMKIIDILLSNDKENK